MNRSEDWPERLSAYIANAWQSPQPHQFGIMDCCLYVAGAIEALSGIDVAEEWSGTYDDLAGAQEAVAEFGGGVEAMLEAFATEHGWREVGLNYIQRGDVLFIPASGLGTVLDFDGIPAIWSGAQPTFFLYEGWAFTKREVIARAWHFD